MNVKGNIIFLDGAMGTELQRRGVRTDLPLWSAIALIEAPRVVSAIHTDYVQAGADVITTNTFRTHRRTLTKAGIDDAIGLTTLAVRLAREAADSADRRILVAGSIAPLEDCFRPDLSPGRADQEFIEIVSVLAGEGCDLLLIETMNNIEELKSAIRGAAKQRIEYWVSVNPSNRDPSRLLSGETLLEALRVAEGEGASRFLVNCAGMSVIEAAVKQIADAASVPFGGYANNGVPDDISGWRFEAYVSPSDFAAHCERMVALGATIIGGCCGTSPEHIAAAAVRIGKPSG